MRRAAFLFSLALSVSSAAAKDPDAPPPYPFSPAERSALTRALENSAEMTQPERLLLLAALRRGISRGQLDRLTPEEKTAMMTAAYAASGDDANAPGIEPEERKRRLRDWVILYDELDRAVYPMLTPQPNRYIIGRDVGAVSARTPVQPAPSSPGGQTPPLTQTRPPEPQTLPQALRAPPAGTVPPPPLTSEQRPGDLVQAGPEGWTPAPSAQEMAAAAAGPAGPADGGKVDLTKAEGSVGRGMGAASALADGTRSSPGAPGGPGGGAGPGPSRGLPPSRSASGAPAPGAATGDPSAPASVADMALAQGPYKPAFDAAGLAVGRKDGAPAVLRRDGTPASPQELNALSQRIAAMPRAAMRDPSYLDPQRGISWERFQELKGGLPRNAGREELKHIGLSPDERDLQRTESCDKVSGACNPLAKASYKKGEDVPAKELDSIWGRINDYLAKSEAKTASPRAARAALKSKGIWERVSAVFGFGGGAREAETAADGPPVAAPAAGPAADGETAQAGVASESGAPEGAPAPRRRSPLLALLFAGGVVLAAVPLLRSRWLRDV